MKKIQIGKESIVTTSEVKREEGRLILAHGEVTGHAHAIVSKSAKLYTVDDDAALLMGTRILSARSSVALTHEEHSKIDVPPGTWGVRIQRQYDEGVSRPVQD